ncbi:hypothetical protein BDR26DRAFT_900179 [Obelidium mucronatum]|nr:hypothetical protein BDR26DRAFT_900179 [Obelidium mucronatum]
MQPEMHHLIRQSHQWLCQHHDSDPDWPSVEKAFLSLAAAEPGTGFGQMLLDIEQVRTLANNKMIYNSIIDEIFEYWNQQAKQNGNTSALFVNSECPITLADAQTEEFHTIKGRAPPEYDLSTPVNDCMSAAWKTLQAATSLAMDGKQSEWLTGAAFHAKVVESADYAAKTALKLDDPVLNEQLENLSQQMRVLVQTSENIRDPLYHPKIGRPKLKRIPHCVEGNRVKDKRFKISDNDVAKGRLRAQIVNKKAIIRLLAKVSKDNFVCL